MPVLSAEQEVTARNNTAIGMSFEVRVALLKFFMVLAAHASSVEHPV
jgi:hypothetical protein